MPPLFQKHLDLSKQYFKKLLQPGDVVIDATCGNGHDTQVLASQILTEESGTLYALDIQTEALESTKKRLQEELSQKTFDRIHFLKRCHSTFPNEIKENSVKLIVYNLGYLPHGDKSITTISDTTLKSIENALKLVSDEGAISITCYPGHPAGEIEEKEILNFAANLNPYSFVVCHHRFINRDKSPSLLILQKR